MVRRTGDRSMMNISRKTSRNITDHSLSNRTIFFVIPRHFIS